MAAVTAVPGVTAAAVTVLKRQFAPDEGAVAAGVLTFAFAVLEVSDSLILAQTQDYYPITKQLYELATSTGSPETGYQAAALGVYGMALLGGSMALAGAVLGKRLGAIFRA